MVTIPDSVKVIGNGAFNESSITRVTIGKNVKKIGQSVFAYCNKLTRLDLSNFVTNKVTDMSYMFEDCNSLTSLNMRNSVFDSVKTTSYIFMFKNTPNLTTIYVKDSSAQTWINTRLSEEAKTGVTVTIA